MASKKQQGFRADVQRAKQQSVVQLLFKCARLLNERAIESLREAHDIPIRVAHTALFPHINMTEGSRLTDLAEALGVSKQAVGQLVDDLVQMGILQRRADPNDGRAKRVCYTKAGRRGILEGLALLKEQEQDIGRAIGKARLKALHEALLALEGFLDPEE